MVSRWFWKHQFVWLGALGFATVPNAVGLIYLFSVVVPRNDAVLITVFINGLLVGGLNSLVYAYLARRYTRKFE